MPFRQYDNHMISEGIKDHNTFAQLHPIVTTVWFILVTGVTMFSNAPWVLGLSLFMATAYRILLNGKKDLKSSLILIIGATVLVTVINGFFTHNGATVLFYIGANRITLEAFIFGLCMSMMFTAVAQWLICFSVITTSDKMIYIFGSILPVIGLVLSIIFRSIPLLRKRFSDIDAAQKAMGRAYKKGLVRKGRQLVKEISILTAWSLESSIDTADSMTARGYGLHGRTSFHLYHFERRDAVSLTCIAACAAVVIFGCVKNASRIYYYPTVRLDISELSPAGMAVFVCVLILLLVTPVLIDLAGEYAWRKYESTL